MSMTIAPFGDRFVIKTDDGKTIVSDATDKNGYKTYSPFKTIASAKKRLEYLQKNPDVTPTYADEDTLTGYAKKYEASNKKSASSQANAPLHRPTPMSMQEFERVQKVYARVTSTFTRDQLDCLNGLLQRFAQAWNLTTTNQKETAPHANAAAESKKDSFDAALDADFE